MSLTIDQIKKKKIKLESSVLKLLQDFEKDASTFVGYIDTERKPSKETKKNDISDSVAIPEPERDGPLINININLRFDI